MRPPLDITTQVYYYLVLNLHDIFLKGAKGRQGPAREAGNDGEPVSRKIN